MDTADYLRLAWAQIASGQANTVLGLLLRLAESAQKRDQVGNLIQIMILHAIALKQIDQAKQALETLDQALILAQPFGLIRSFIDHKLAILPLLKRLKSEGKRSGLKSARHVDYVNLLLAACGEDPQQTPQHQLKDPLSDRELDVLRLMPTHLTGPEIAGELFIS